MDIDILATYHTPPTAADLATYRRQLRTALRLAGAAGATLAALDSRDKAARAAQPNSYARFSLPSDTNAASKAYDRLHRLALDAACVLFAAGDITAEQLAQVINPLCPPPAVRGGAPLAHQHHPRRRGRGYAIFLVFSTHSAPATHPVTSCPIKRTA